jgi:hypothetical protein
MVGVGVGGMVAVGVGEGERVGVGVGVGVGVNVDVGVGVGVAVGVDVGVRVGVTVAVAVGVVVGVAVGVGVAVVVAVEVGVEVGAMLVGSGLCRNPNTSTAARPVRIMAAKKAAGTKIGIEMRLLCSSLFREAPQIRHSLALRATRLPQAGQCLFSSAILAHFQKSTLDPARWRCLAWLKGRYRCAHPVPRPNLQPLSQWFPDALLRRRPCPSISF